ncbi:MAG: sulfur carrier protein ThiS [Wenzhouxiangellaceae bacterium]
MEVTVNGKPQSLPEGLSVEALLDRLGHADKRVAVERNGEIVPRSLHAAQQLSAHDRIEIVHAIGGG